VKEARNQSHTFIPCSFHLGIEVTRIVNLTVTTIWVRFTWVFCSCVSDFYSCGKRVATWSSHCALKSLCRHTYYICAVCLFFFNTDKKTQMWFL